MKFINYITAKLFPTAPVNTDRPPTGSIYEWRSVDSSGNLLIHYRMTTGPDKTFSINNSYTLPTASATVSGAIKVGNNLSISNGVLSATMPVASQSVFGAIKVGNNLSISNGVLSAVSNYSLGKATTSALGGVIVGNNIAVDANGVISVVQGAGYNLPTATNLVKGGVKIGANVSVTGDGTISVAAPYSLVTASPTTLGGIKVGNNLVISNGVLSAVWPTAYTLPAATNGALGGVIIGSGINLLNGTISVTPYTLPAATTLARGGVKIGANINVDGNGVISVAAPYSLPAASTLVLGGVKQGTGCVIDGNGVINVTAINVVVHSATEKLSIADADELPLMDSAATYALKKVSWTTIKATLWSWLYNTFVIAPKPTFLSKSGHNYQSMLIDGKLYTTTGYWGDGLAIHCSGRGLNGQNPYWGVNEFKRVSFPSSSDVIQTGGGGHEVAYALLSDGKLYTWGQNQFGACGLGANVAPVGFPTLSLTGVQTVYSHPSMGGFEINYNRLFVEKTDGTIWACGDGSTGALGNGSIVGTNSTWTHVAIIGPNEVDKLFNLGASHGCTVVLKTDGTIWACGSNRQGYLGLNDSVVHSTFQDITMEWAGVASGVLDLKVTGVFGLGFGSLLMLITLPDNSKIVRACGCNSNGQLGNGNITSQDIPVTVLNSSTVVDIAMFGSTQNATCQMLKANGQVYAWGYNGCGQVGDNTIIDKSTPVLVASNVAKLLSDGMTAHYNGHFSQAYIVTTDGRLWSCGYNEGGKYCATGSVATNVVGFSPVLMPYDESVVDLGHFNTGSNGRVFLALTAKGNIYAWGSNVKYGLSRHTNSDGYAPVQITMPLLNQ